MNRDDWKSELNELLDSLTDRELTDDQMERLDEIVGSNSDARHFYMRHMLMVSLLEREDASDMSVSLPAQTPDATAAGQQKYSAPLLILVTAAVVLLMVGGMLGWLSIQRSTILPSPTTAEIARPELLDRGIALVGRAVDLRTSDGNEVRQGDTLEPGSLTLDAGLLALEFYSGASVLVESPAQLELIDSMTVVCRFGKVTARVPSQATGFTIRSPQTEVVDLGTEFGMDVSADGETSVHVFDGEVELYDLASNRSPESRRSLTAGGGMELGPNGQRREIDAQRGHFVSDGRLRERDKAQRQQNFERWKEHSEAVGMDARVIAYFPFLRDEDDDRALMDYSPNGKHEGSIVGCAWATGRWPAKGALEFKRPGDRVRIHIPGEYESLTWAAWVRVDGLDRRFNSLLLTDGFEVGAPHWQITRAGDLVLGIRHSELRADFTDYVASGALDLRGLGQWQHLVTVYDRPNSQVTSYLNGDPISRSPISQNTALRIGDAVIGNWGRSIDESVAPYRNFNGSMDELTVYGAALNADEVKQLHASGRP